MSIKLYMEAQTEGYWTYRNNVQKKKLKNPYPKGTGFGYSRWRGWEFGRHLAEIFDHTKGMGYTQFNDKSGRV